MNFGDLTIASDGMIYPATAETALGLWLARRGDSSTFTNFKGKMFCYLGDGSLGSADIEIGDSLGDASILYSYGLSMPASDPTISRDDTYILDGSGHVFFPFVLNLAWKNTLGTVTYHSHLQGANGIDLGGRMVKFNSIVYFRNAYGTDEFPIYTTAYYSTDGEVFTNKVGTAALSETDFDDSVLWDWVTATNTVRFNGPRICQTLFDSNGKACLTSSYGEKQSSPLYQNYRAVPSSATLYAYVYGQQADLSSGSNGTLAARVKVYENGVWLNRNNTEVSSAGGTGSDPIFDPSQWEFWNGYFWSTDLENAKLITGEVDYQWTSEVQFDRHRNKFIMVRSIVSTNFFYGGWPIGTSSYVSLLESETPYGPFTNEKILIETTRVSESTEFVSDCSIFGILKDKIILSVNFSMPMQTDCYNIEQIGYGGRFGSVPIT